MIRLENGVAIAIINIDVPIKEIEVIDQRENDANVNDFLSEYTVGAR